MEKIDLSKLTVADVIITDMNYIEEENKTEIEFNSPLGRGMMTIDYNNSEPSEDGDGYESVEADLALEAIFDDKEYEDAVFNRLFDLLGEAMAIISKQIEDYEKENNIQ